MIEATSSSIIASEAVFHPRTDKNVVSTWYEFLKRRKATKNFSTKLSKNITSNAPKKTSPAPKTDLKVLFCAFGGMHPAHLLGPAAEKGAGAENGYTYSSTLFRCTLLQFFRRMAQLQHFPTYFRPPVYGITAVVPQHFSITGIRQVRGTAYHLACFSFAQGVCLTPPPPQRALKRTGWNIICRMNWC